MVRESYDSNNQVAREKTVFESNPEDSRGGRAALGRDDNFDGGFGDDFDYDAIPVGGGSGFELETGTPAASRAPRSGGRRGQRAQSRGQGQGTAARGQNRSVVERSIRHPAALLLYKMLVIAVVSFGFAALTTYIYSRMVL